jgi:hypothetical protein
VYSGIHPRKGYHSYGRSTYADITGPTGYLARAATFKGHSMVGTWCEYKGQWYYLVLSFDALIAIYNPKTGKRVISNAKYGRATTYHQKLCRAWLQGADLVLAAANRGDAAKQSERA